MVETKDEKKANNAESISKEEVRDILNEKHNSRGRGLTDPEKRAKYEAYEKRKKMVFELEKRNSEYLVLFLSSTGNLMEDKTAGKFDKENYYIMGGNSALIYVSQIAPKIGRQAKLHSDDDNSETRFRTGIAKVRGIENLTKALQGIGVERVDTRSMDEVVYFKLNESYTQKELERAIKELKAMKKEANELLQPKVVYPGFNQKAFIRLRTDLLRKIATLRHEYYILLAPQMTSMLMEMKWEYLKIVRGTIDEKEGLKRIQMLLDRLSDAVAMLQELDIWDVLFVIRTAEMIVKIQKNVDELMVAYDKKKLKESEESERKVTRRKSKDKDKDEDKKAGKDKNKDETKNKDEDKK